MAQLPSGPAYRIETPRLVIRCWEPKDAPMMKETIDANIDHLKPYLPWAAGYPKDLQLMIDQFRTFRGKFDLDQDFVYGIFNPSESRVIGGTGLHLRLGPGAREIGYWLHKDFTGQGLATETSAALTRVAFVIEAVERVEIHCAVENALSAAVPIRLGFHHDATLRHRTLLLDGLYHDTMVFSLLREEFPHTPCAAAELKAYDVAGRKIL